MINGVPEEKRRSREELDQLLKKYFEQGGSVKYEKDVSLTPDPKKRTKLVLR